MLFRSRGRFQAVDLPGANLTFTKSDTPTIPTRGRVLDHIGFDVKDLDAFAKKLQADGVQIEAPGMRTSPNASRLHLFYIMDPWGTYIEITNGLPPAPEQSASR